MATRKPIPITPLTPSETERFWSKVDIRGPEECWPWKPPTFDGYGLFKYQRKNIRANRVSYFLYTNDDPAAMGVLHSCDFRACVNPKHLRKGTVQDNMRDRHQRGRDARGDRHWTHLYPEKVSRGILHSAHLHPETRVRGDAHWTRARPEAVRRGESVSISKLTWAKVQKIRAMSRSNIPIRQMARIFGVTCSTISSVAKGKTWKEADVAIEPSTTT